MDILRFCILGNIDDGKSTFIGRLLYDTNTLKEDQLARLKNHQLQNDLEHPDFSTITDGLFDEQMQKITIDVAYQYFQSHTRKYIIADAPGHEQLTRNMATGASVSNLAVIMVDATRGVASQTKKHCIVASLMEIKQCIFCVNKMDLRGYDQNAYKKVESELLQIVNALNFEKVSIIPISASKGDNLTKISPQMPWYYGNTVIAELEAAEIPSTQTRGLRVPIQFSLNGLLYGYVVNGSLKKGDEVLVLPDNKKNKVLNMYTAGVKVESSSGGDAVALELDGDFSPNSRGIMLSDIDNPPVSSTEIKATLIWFANESGSPNKNYILRHNTRSLVCPVSEVNAILHTDSMAWQTIEGSELKTNEIYSIRMASESDVFWDNFSALPGNGCFLLCDAENNETLAAGMIGK